MSILLNILTVIMNFCYRLCRNYGLAIILFTLISKIVLMPLSVWVQKNSIKMVKMQPEINHITARFFGDKDRIAEETNAIYKRYKYNPFASIIPMAVQILLLMGLIEVIKAGMLDPSIDMTFFGHVDLSLVPSQTGGMLVLSPLLAGVSAWILCVAQNASNVLQAEQSKANKYGMMAFSVGLSLYLGWFVAVGVAVYWMASNLFAVLQLYLLNWLIPPKKYVDYEALEKSKQELAALKNLGDKKRRFGDAESRRERADYKRFFKIANKHIVFYSENTGFYKYFRGIIEELLRRTNLTIHYITSDPNDAIFQLAETQPKIKPYYIGEKKLITLMMKMEADVVVMTMPDLENYHIKRSYVSKDVEYVFIPHDMGSYNLTCRQGCVDHFDTVFCTGKEQRAEVEATEKVYGLPKKKIVDWGYCLLDQMRADYAAAHTEDKPKEKKTILIAPSWQPDNIVDSCLEEMLDNLKDLDYHIIVRPHPQHVRHMPEKMESLKAKYGPLGIEIQTDFSSNSTVFEADMMITDWSGIAYEYAFTTCRPVLFIDTPMKIMNPEYQKIDVKPINIWMRAEIGAVVAPDHMNELAPAVTNLIENSAQYHDKIDRFVHEYVYNLGSSAQVGADYLISAIQAKIQKRKEQ